LTPLASAGQVPVGDNAHYPRRLPATRIWKPKEERGTDPKGTTTMEKTAHDHSDPTDFDQGEFRHLAAKVVKLLIRARWKCEPAFLPYLDLPRWGLGDVEKDHASAPSLLEQAADALDELARRFLPGFSSGVPADWDDEPTPAGRVQARLFQLISRDDQ